MKLKGKRKREKDTIILEESLELEKKRHMNTIIIILEESLEILEKKRHIYYFTYTSNYTSHLYYTIQLYYTPNTSNTFFPKQREEESHNNYL